jgi:hypothetical protein
VTLPQRRKSLQRKAASEIRIFGKVNDAHPAPTQLVEDPVATDGGGARRSAVCQELVGTLVRFEERQNPGAEIVIVAARVAQQLGPALGRLVHEPSK